MLTQRLYRSRGEHMIAGVCGGIAQYVAIDPTLVRLFAVLAAIFSGGLIVLLYFVLWLVVPEEPFGAPTSAQASTGTSESAGSTGPTDPAGAGSAFGSASSWSSFGSYGFPPTDDVRRRRSRWIGWVLLGLGVLVLGSNLHLFSWVHWDLIWPLFLILGGFFLLARQRRQY